MKSGTFLLGHPVYCLEAFSFEKSQAVMLEYNIRTLFFQNCNEGFLQHVWVCCTSYYAFGKKGRPVTCFVGIGHRRWASIFPCTCSVCKLLLLKILSWCAWADGKGLSLRSRVFHLFLMVLFLYNQSSLCIVIFVVCEPWAVKLDSVLQLWVPRSLPKHNCKERGEFFNNVCAMQLQRSHLCKLKAFMADGP